LLDALRFDEKRDTLWFVGDLVNRGPESLACLRFVKSLGDRAIAVLGNHDLHLVCVAEGAQKSRKRDTLEEVLAAPDLDELTHWIRHRPLLHVEGGFVLVHAGLIPEWTVGNAQALAREVQAALRAKDYLRFLQRMYGDEPARWDDSLEGWDRLRVITNAMTRLRVLHPDGTMALGYKGEPGEATTGLTPWFDAPRRKSRDHAIVCGHWSALGLAIRDDLLSLDSGCVWGRALTAVRLEDREVFSVACPAPRGRAA